MRDESPAEQMLATLLDRGRDAYQVLRRTRPIPPGTLAENDRMKWATVFSALVLVARTFKAARPLMDAAKTGSLRRLVIGMLSPVIGDWSTSEVPSAATPSVATDSPGWTKDIAQSQVLDRHLHGPLVPP